MEHNEPRLIRSASFKSMYPIAGLIGGLILGIMTTVGRRGFDELATLRHALQCAIWGFFLGLAIVLLTSVTARGLLGPTSTKRLIALVALAALLCWFASSVLMHVVAG